MVSRKDQVAVKSVFTGGVSSTFLTESIAYGSMNGAGGPGAGADGSVAGI